LRRNDGLKQGSQGLEMASLRASKSMIAVGQADSGQAKGSGGPTKQNEDGSP
jgi:hypothetical protein